MAQTVRFTTLEKFKAGELRLLVCSDVAARGLDIGGLSHVFNFDVPHHAEDYVHRIGRTGRAGLEGHAFTIAMPEDRLAVAAIEKLTGHPIPPMIVEGLDPVDWAEVDSRKRRGRKAPAGKKAPAAKTARGKQGADRAPRQAPPPNGHEVPVAEVPRMAAPEEPVARAPERVEPPAAREPAPRMREPRREVSARPPGREAERRPQERQSQERQPQERHPQERQRWRQDDLGPAVVGFGDDVPAFMMVRRRPALTPMPETDA
jgi:superfamily II DNA/RNA helicase